MGSVMQCVCGSLDGPCDPYGPYHPSPSSQWLRSGWPPRFVSYSRMTSYPSRRSIRLPGYDYSQPGAYFVTLCIEQRLPLLGAIIDDEVDLSPAGAMVATIWSGLGERYPGVSVDAYTVMPNHLHGILWLFDPSESADEHVISPDHASALSLPTVIQRFKTYTAHLYGKGVASDQWSRYRGRLWQHRFHEHVIRNERDLQAIREYIANNPRQWRLDRENPERQRDGS